MAEFSCVASLPQGEFEAQARITQDGLVLHGPTKAQRFELGFVDLMDMRLLNYRLLLSMRSFEARISQLGYHTEDFFEQLWQAFRAQSRRSLFVEGTPLMEAEGDYAYVEPDGTRHGIAKLELYPDCLCVFPHDAGSRRVPLCFCEPPERERFAVSLTLDTGEHYRIARLGGDTDPFFGRLFAARDEAVGNWQAAHRKLEATLVERLGAAEETRRVFEAQGASVSCGLFDPNDEAFWLAGIKRDKAAIELVTSENSAVYLYDVNVSPEEFVLRVRHAMEAVRTNRRVIYLPERDLGGEPLYRMAIERSSHVRFLRACNAGRIVHSGDWSTRLADYLG